MEKQNMKPDWIDAATLTKIIELKDIMEKCKQDGFLVISKEQAYFQLKNNIEAISLEKDDDDNSCMDLHRIKNDLMDFKIDPYPEIMEPYSNEDDDANKLSTLLIFEAKSF